MKKKEEENPIPFTNICTSRSSERIVYLVEGLEMKTELPGCSGASRASSSSPRCSTSTSSSKSASQLLPPANLRSLSPTISNTNGSTLCAQYRQLYAADFLEREDDRNCEQLMCVGQWDTAANLDNRNCGNHQQKTET